eukprot:7388479-Prymnesium_polylepis.2
MYRLRQGHLHRVCFTPISLDRLGGYDSPVRAPRSATRVFGTPAAQGSASAAQGSASAAQRQVVDSFDPPVIDSEDDRVALMEAIKLAMVHAHKEAFRCGLHKQIKTREGVCHTVSSQNTPER